MADNFLNRLYQNPRQPLDAASITRVDELGNGYDDFGQMIQPKFEQPQQTWGETALGVATAPARLATALADSISPYGSEGWRMPPVIDEGVNALTAVGDAYNYGMDQDEINSRALGMAGFMMGGGGLAARPSASAVAAHPEWLRLSKSHPNKGGLYPAVQIEGQVYAGMPSHMDAIERAYGALGQKRVDRTYGRGDLGYIGKDGAWMSREDAGMRLYGEPAEMDSTALYSNASKEGGLLSNILGYFQGNKEPVTVRGYHGTRSEFDKFNGPSVYASENPAAASEWAMVANRDGEAPNVLPLDITASNPYYAKSLFPDQAELDRIAAADPDVVFYPPSTQHGTTFDKYPGQVFEARKPGTVRSATTGETLYSNASKEGAIPALLDMGQEARLARAEKRYDTSMPWYHGTRAGEFDEFDPSLANSSSKTGVPDGATVFSSSPENASTYAAFREDMFGNPQYGDGAAVMPVYLDKSTLDMVVDAKGANWRDIEYNGQFYDANELAQIAKDLEYEGLLVRNVIDSKISHGAKPADTYFKFSPQGIRSVNAAFDPSKANSTNLLAANADSRPALLGAGQEQDIPDWLFPYLGR